MTQTKIIAGTNETFDVLRRELFGRSIVSAEIFDGYRDGAEGALQLDDGRTLLLAGNDGCGGCSAGHYWLERLVDGSANGILNVTFDVVDDPDNPDDDAPTRYRIFVVVEDRGPVELAAFKGDDGNGYYGTGFWFRIVAPTPTEEAAP